MVEVIKTPEPNFIMRMGEGSASFQFHMEVKKSWQNRIKYWLFFQFFPFQLVKWTEREEA